MGTLLAIGLFSDIAATVEIFICIWPVSEMGVSPEISPGSRMLKVAHATNPFRI